MFSALFNDGVLTDEFLWPRTMGQRGWVGSTSCLF